ncbi:MAG: S41 family peptidase [Planctomycetota bacterium]|jgi:carboxyl-terminal processing protease|nr:S41 family peptidase [Planctomycetota bacterium]
MKPRLLFVICLLIRFVPPEGLAAGDFESGLYEQAFNPEVPAWETAGDLTASGYARVPELARDAADPALPHRWRLAASAALLRLGEQRSGVSGLEAVAMDSGVPLPERLEAAQILGKWGGEYASARLGVIMNAPDVPERLRVEFAYGLWRLSSRPQAYDILDEIRRRGATGIARAEAVLALGRTDRFPYVKDEIKALADEPGAIGERAENLLLINSRLDDEIDRDDFTVRLISEVVQKIRDFYAADEDDRDQVKRLEPKSLGEASAQALLYSLDQFNDYLNEEDFSDFESQLRANYGGIGAWVGMRDGRFTILTPMFDKPAHRAGLRPMDVIDRIDEVDISDLRQNEIIKLLKGEPGTMARLRVHRRSWKEPRVIQVKREIIAIESVVSQVLPGNIGYIKINSFNDGDQYRRVKGTPALVKDALASFAGQGIRGLIVDLTNNPGGVMVSGVDVAKLFLGDSKLIVSSRGKRGSRRVTEYKAGLRAPFWQGPVVMVVNPGTASAAEILAGAMRDHKRAPLVGRKTYGKGSVQSLIGVKTTRDRSRIKLTVAKYYLPNGDCIHGKGIDPDFRVPENELSGNELEARWKIRDQHDVMFWLEENDRFTRHEDEYRRLLEFDNLDPYAYPEFDSLLAALQIKYPKDQIDAELCRKELRYGLTTYLHDFKGENRYVDLEENSYLQEAIVVLGEAMGGLPETPLFTAIRGMAEENRKKLSEEEGNLAKGR